jgi:hypothetical protein
LSSNSRPTPQTRSEVGVPELNAQFVPLALAEKRGFFREDGLQAEVIRVEREISLSEVADLSLLKEVQKELGIKEK